jgi:hypothetical protein
MQNLSLLQNQYPSEVLRRLRERSAMTDQATGYREGTGVAGMGKALREAKDLTIGRPEAIVTGSSWPEKIMGAVDLLGVTLPGRAMRLPISLTKSLWKIGKSSTQLITSAGTASGNAARAPSLFKQGWFKRNTKNLDIGGGPAEHATTYLRDKYGIENLTYDPFNRTASHNTGVIKAIESAGGMDSVTLSNVLNVIREPANRLKAVRQAIEAVKPGGTIQISIYKAPTSGVTTKGFQMAEPLSFYLNEMKDILPGATSRGGIIEWTKPY